MKAKLYSSFSPLSSQTRLLPRIERVSRYRFLMPLLAIMLIAAAQTAFAQDSAMSESEMQDMLNQMNSWQGNGAGGGMQQMQRPMQQMQPYMMQQPMNQMPMQQQYPMQQLPMQQMQQMPMQQMQQMPMQQMQQMPMQQMQQMPMQQMQQMPMQQMQQMPMQQMQQMPMQQINPMQMMGQGMPPLEAGIGSGAQMNPGIGQKFNISNLLERKIVGNGGMGFGNIFQRMQQLNAASAGSNPNSSASQSARDAIEYELGVARSMASQAVAYSDQARSGNDRSAKQSAASQSRYYASEARKAAERAEARVSECPQAAGMASSARGESNRAQSAAAYAADAASGW